MSDSNSDLGKTCKKNKLSAESIHMAWHVLPRQAARVVPSATSIAGSGFPEIIGLDNQGIGTAQNNSYSCVQENLGTLHESSSLRE